MGFYSNVIFPWLCDLVLDRPFLAKYRRELLAEVSGDILEIGFGTGLNLPHYPEHVKKITTVEPSGGMNRRAEKRIKQSGIEVDQRVLSSEKLPFADNTFDCVVSTFTLCSIDDVDQALSEVWRVLKPGGRFMFFEHGLSHERRVQKRQCRHNRLGRYLAGGCRLDRNIRDLVAHQAFASVEIEEFYLKRVPKTHGFIYRGSATK